ncbi:MAG: hypothetical protein M1838_003853, partial [Thelocarpon superellum]
MASNTSTKPTIVIVPGFWEGPEVFDEVTSTLQAVYGYKTHGPTSPGNPTQEDDVVAIRQKLEPLVEAGEEVLLVAHSAGGFLASNAIEGLSLKERAGQGKSGGVVKRTRLARRGI